MKKTTITIDQLIREINTLPSVIGNGYVTCQCDPKEQIFNFILKYGKVYEYGSKTVSFNLKELISVYEKAIKLDQYGKLILSNNQFKWEAKFEKGNIVVYKTELH